MNKTTRLLLVGALTVSTLFVSAGTALGCSCLMPDAEQLFANSDGAFVGRLVHGEPNTGGGMNQVPFTFEVVSAHKGDIVDPMVVFSADNGAACGLEMGQGSEASLFIYRTGDTWQGDLCSTMGPEALTTFPEVAVGAGKGMTATEESVDSASGLARWALGGILIAGAGAVLAIKLKQRDLTELEEQAQ